MSLIDTIIAMLGAIESDAIAVHDERCISVRNRNADCLRCVESCTSGALAYRVGEIAVEPDRCIGCGTCATACPTCAIELRNPTDDELTKQVKRAIAASKGHPVFACATALRAAEAQAEQVRGGKLGNRSQQATLPCDEAHIVETPCLGRLDESLLVGLAAYRATDATLVCGDCVSCAHAPGGALVRTVVDGARNLLAAFGSDFSLEFADELPQREASVQASARAQGVAQAVDGAARRAAFKSAKDASVHAVTTAVSHEVSALAGNGAEPTPPAYRKVGKDGMLSHFVPTRRVRLYNYLKQVGQPIVAEVETRVIGSVAIDTEKCRSCRMCAVFCPTGALAKFDEDGAWGIVHRPSACMQCRLCERLCPEDAVAVSGLVPIDQFMGKQAVCYAMKKPTWEPNKPASMYGKVHTVLGDDLEMCMF